MHRRSAFEPREVPNDPESVRRGVWAFLKTRPARVYSEGDPGNFHRRPTPPSEPCPDLDPNDDEHAVSIAAHIMDVPRPQVIHGAHESAVGPRLYAPLFEAAWELVHAGILRLAEPKRNVVQPGDFPPAFNITLHGRRCLEAGDPAFPLDSTGQVEAFAEEFKGTPNVKLMITYLSEAIEAYRRDLTLASATMIGCAYESAVLQLAKAVAAKWPPDTEPTLNAKLKEAAKKHLADEYAPAGVLIDVSFRCLDAHKGDIGSQWGWVQNCFRDTFHLVREVRNEAGHPTGNVIDRDVVFTKIVNLRQTYRHVRAIIDAIS